MTDTITKLRDLMAKATPGPWEIDTERSEGEYGSAPDTSTGYDDFLIGANVDGKWATLLTTENSTIKEIEEDYDEDYHRAWDRILATHIALATVGKVRPFKRAMALHRCDNPTCVNPAHLSWGTAADNMADCMARGRQRRGLPGANAARGSRHGKARLNAAKVRYIRSSAASNTDLAAELGVTNQCISSVRTGRTWTHVE